VPIYEYRCPRCEHAFEELVSFSGADDPRACPACDCTRAERKLSTFAVRVAGSARSAGGSGKGCAGCGKSSCANC
jgi:putative FmdB family regulatory protein